MSRKNKKKNSKKNSKKNRNTVIVGKELGKLEFESSFAVGILPHLSSLTVIDKKLCLRKIGRQMESYGLSTIREISAELIERFFQELRAEGLTNRRIGNYASAMRLLCNMLGKPEIVPTNAQLGCVSTYRIPALR